MKKKSISIVTAFATAALIALTGCATTPEVPAEATPAGESVAIENAWIKATDTDMTAAFGELTNTGSTDIVLIAATSEVSPELQLHETVANESGEMEMREKGDGFTVRAGETLTLEPGGNHIMLLGLESPIMAGDEITVTLEFSDGSRFVFTSPAKDFSGANESYEGDGMSEPMDMGAALGGTR